MDILMVLYPLGAALTAVVAIGLGIYLGRKFGLGQRLWWLGAATFVLSQVGHIPFNSLMTNLFNTGVLPTPAEAAAPLFNAVFLGLSAGLFEELARFAMFRWFAKDARSWGKALMTGAGHGGIEALIFGTLIGLLSYIQLVALRSADLASMVPPEQLQQYQQAVQQYWGAPWYLTLVPTIERILAIILQVSLAVLVAQVFIRRQWFWLPVAILYHALVDAVAVYLLYTVDVQGNGVWIIEGVVALFALFSLGIIFYLRSPEPVEEAAPVEPVEPVAVEPLEATDESVERSRYSD